MKVKELIEELKKYDDDTEVYVEWWDNEFWKTYLSEPWLNFKKEVRYNNLEGDIVYANTINCDWIMNNILTIN